MIKQSSILRWTHNAKHNHKTSSGVREWIHPSDALQRGHIAYLVKFLGSTEVDQAKGIEVVKEGIRKLKFSSQLKKAEGSKPPKVELTISIDGVAIQEPKTKRILHQYPLHRISYCADDKAEKKFFSFIAKEADFDKHVCFVFVSDKLSEEITLTIGQAFDLAYRRFLETSGRDLEMRKQIMILQKKIQTLEDENRDLKQRLSDVLNLKNKNDVDHYMQENKINNLTVANGDNKANDSTFFNKELVGSFSVNNGAKESTLSPSQELFNELGTSTYIGAKLENLSFDDFNPRADDEPKLSPPLTVNGVISPTHTQMPFIRPPPPPIPHVNGNNHASPSHITHPETITSGRDLFGAEPFLPPQSQVETTKPVEEYEDPFGMGDFDEVPSHLGAQELENAIGRLDRRISEMRDGFSRGISFGNDDFSLETLDPFHNKQSN
ncbi:adaptor protein, phosphotyrosine interaction, PH domain and leucine zipper containing [Chamberlinius hualienensis]